MPRIRTKTQPNKVREVSEKDLIDLERWGMILEILPEEEPVKEAPKGPAVSQPRSRKTGRKVSGSAPEPEKESEAPGLTAETTDKE